MTRGNSTNWLGIFSGLSLLAAIALFVVELVLYSRTFSAMPAGLSLGGVPVGGLSEAAALEQLVTAYGTPLQLDYLGDTVLLDPAVVNFEINTGVMLPEAQQFRTSAGFWNGFWAFLWLQPSQVRDIPLRASYSQERLRAFLEDVAARYDRPGSPPQADVNSLGFIPGARGHALDVDAAISLINAKLLSPTERQVELPIVEQTAIRPSFDTLADLLRDDVRVFQYPGIFSLYLADLESGRELVVHLNDRADIQGPIAFSGMSTIKIPIMVSFFAHNVGTLTEEQDLLLQRTIDESANAATDLLLRTIGQGDAFDGARQVIADMQRLGLNNTYIAGLLDTPGAVFAPPRTPANARADITTLPDPYNQTTSEDMGTLLMMIYQCAEGGGALFAAFPGQLTTQECQTMINLLTRNEALGIFIAGGSPGGVVAHKHGWDSDPLTNVADAAIVFTPTGNYALTIFMHRADTMGFEEANRLMISVARAIYNFFVPAES
jgi:beta-lactamase class A